MTDGSININLFFISGVALNTIKYDKNAAIDDHNTPIISKTVHTHTGGCTKIINAARGMRGVTE